MNIYCLLFPLALLCEFQVAICVPYNPKSEKVLICGVCKNVAFALPNMIRKMETLGKRFKDYRIIIYENNSKDKTAKFLKKWAKKNHKVILISEKLTVKELYARTKTHALRDQAACRMELIAYGRNQVLRKARSPEFNDFKFLVMTDMDFVRGWQVDDIVASLALPIEWDCIAANGIGTDYVYYDYYAYRAPDLPLGPELIMDKFWEDVGTLRRKIEPHEPLIPVYSAFAGVAIYKMDVLRHCSYSGYVTPQLKTLMFTIINALPSDHPHYRYYKNLVQADGSDLPVKFRANSGYDGPTVCEHVTLHADMILKGFDKIYINPALICHRY